MKKFVVVAALALLSVGCGAYGTGTGGNPTPTPSGGLRFDVTATEKDHAVTMHVGQTLQVVLHGTDQFSYQQVRSSDQLILEPTVNPAESAARGVLLAAFRAKAPGQATVTAVGAPVCPSGQACPMYAVLYSLTVTVTP